MSTCGITIGNKSYELTFSHRQTRALMAHWGLGDSLTKYNAEIVKRFKGMDKDFTFKHFDTAVDVIYSAVKGKNPACKLSIDTLYDYLWANQEEMGVLLTAFTEAQTPKPKGKQKP